MKSLLSLLFLTFCYNATWAQYSLPYSSVKTFSTSTQMYNNLYAGMQHPSLSINGFNSINGKGYSLAQIIHRIQQQEASHDLSLFLGQDIRGFEAEIPIDDDAINLNARSLEQQGYLALVSYTMLQNGWQPSLPSILTVVEINNLVQRFKTNLLQSEEWYVVHRGATIDYVKWTNSMMSYARAVDLAFEIKNRC